ncbi:substrate-binding periplasmic protein [Dongshaea marina]|uniref:substrate-binding periplasmic protein n=1 Tax=Dongshaea marina TaxID=2047966 RepID=UPI000D3E894D|nr:transporter substrate-binding domain-containing protein [Dongshaea marina]
MILSQLLRLFILLLLVGAPLTYAKPVVKACGHHDYAPWNWRVGDQIVGACAEVTKTLFEKLGVTVDLSYQGNWQQCQSKIKTGEVDVNICSFINSERQQYSRFIQTPMGYNENAAFVNQKVPFKFSRWSDFDGHTVGMVQGVSIGQKFDDFLRQHTKVVRVTDYRKAFEFLAAKRVDFVPVGRYSGYAMIKAFKLEKQLTDLPKSILTGKLYISMSNKSKYLHLLPEVEKQIQKPGYYPWLSELLQKYADEYGDQFAE